MSHFDEQPDGDPHGECAAEIHRLTRLTERLELEAQIHAQEAKTANHTIAEIYQLCTGKTGEPGNWNGAEPVRQLIAARDAEIKESALKYVSLFGELQNAMEQIALLRERLTPFARFACSPPGECKCNNCLSRDVLTTPQPTE